MVIGIAGMVLLGYAIETDKTLSIPDQPADAAAVRQLIQLINNTKPYIDSEDYIVLE